MMPKPVQAMGPRLCQERTPIPAVPQLDREFARTLRDQRLFVVQEELHRAHEAKPAPPDFFSRIAQAIDVLRGRRSVWVERRRG